MLYLDSKQQCLCTTTNNHSKWSGLAPKGLCSPWWFLHLDTCFRTEITSKGKRHLSRQKVARRSVNPLQKLDQVALVGNQHSKLKVSDKHLNRNIYLDYLPELFQIREEVVRSLKLEGYRNSKLKQVTKTFPVRFQNLVKTFIGVL